VPTRARWALATAILALAVLAGLSRFGHDVRLEELATDCRLADRLRATGQLEDATRLYRQVLASPEARPEEGGKRREQGCASAGLRAIADARCAEGNRLAAAGLTDEARAAFGALLTGTTAESDPGNHGCAVVGLARQPRSTPGVAAPALGATPSSTPTPDVEPGLGRPGFVALARDGARRFAREALSPLAGRSVEATSAEWAGLALLGLVLALAVVARRRRCQLGPLDVGAFANASDKPQLPVELAARITDDLAGLGLPPAAAPPSGSVGTTALDVLGTSPILPAAWLAKVGALLTRMVAPAPPAGTLTGTVLSDGLTIELNIDRQAPVVRTFRGEHAAVARHAAAFAYARFVQVRDQYCTPAWARWTSKDGSSISCYFEGLDHETAAAAAKEKARAATERDAALACYEMAASAEPEQLEVRLRIASLLELRERWNDALRTYLDQVRWLEARSEPPVFEPRYRFAIALSFAAGSLVDDVLADGPLVACLRARDNSLPPTEDRPSWKKAMLRLAIRELDTLHREIGLPAAVRDWMASSRPSRRPYGRRRELAELARPFSQRRRVRRNVVAMGRLCVVLHAADPTTHPAADTERRIRRLLASGRAKNWQLRYNAACCYSRLVALGGKDVDRLYRKAIRLLDAAYWEAGGDLNLAWVERDPDLQPMRDHRPRPGEEMTYADWAERRRPPEPDAATARLRSRPAAKAATGGAGTEQPGR